MQIRQLVRQVSIRTAGLLSQPIRMSIIKVLVRAEEANSPIDAVRWLLDVEDYVATAVDVQCIRWGNGIHIKHDVMDGIHSFFYERIPSGARVLDVGCGRGVLAYDIVNHTDASVVAVDVNREHLEFARQRFQHSRLRFELCDVTKDVLPMQQVDVVVLSSILEHLPNRIELLQTLAQKSRSSLFLIRVPTFERHLFAALKRRLGLFAYTDPTHVLEYSPDLFANEMEQAGLGIRYLETRWGDLWAVCVPTTMRGLDIAD